MAICKDPNNQIERNASLITNLNDFSPNGTLRPSFTETAIEEYSRLVSADIGLNAQTNIIDRFTGQYGKESFDAGLVAINSTLVNKEVFQTNLSDYPYLENRLETLLPITPIEYASYMNDFLQTPNTVVDLVNSNVPLIQSQLNDYYRNNFTDSAIGSFCSLMPNVFGAIAGFFDLVEDLQQKFEDVVNLINNFSIEDIARKFTMKNLITKIKEQIVKIIEDKIGSLKNFIENLSFTSFIGQIETIVNTKIIGRFIELRAQALTFFSEENVKRLKKKAENLVDYAASLFKELTLEDIQFLVYRFCAFAGQIESALDFLKSPLDTFKNDYQNTFNMLKSYGRINTGMAVSSGGANRYSDEERKNRINTGKSKEQSNSPQLPNDLTISELTEAQNISTLEAAKADPRFNIRVNKEQWETLFTKGTNGVVVARLIRLQRLFQAETGISVLNIVSAFRSYEEQRAIWIRNRGGGPAAAAELDNIMRNGLRNPLSGSVALPGASAHQSAKALDINWPGYNRETLEIFCVLAKNKCGFKGFGIYSTSGGIVHIDTRSYKVWGGARGQINFDRVL